MTTHSLPNHYYSVTLKIRLFLRCTSFTWIQICFQATFSINKLLKRHPDAGQCQYFIERRSSQVALINEEGMTRHHPSVLGLHVKKEIFFSVNLANAVSPVSLARLLRLAHLLWLGCQRSWSSMCGAGKAGSAQMELCAFLIIVAVPSAWWPLHAQNHGQNRPFWDEFDLGLLLHIHWGRFYNQSQSKYCQTQVVKVC